MTELLSFKNKEYNIEDVSTSKNLNRLQAQEILNLNIIVNAYKAIELANPNYFNNCYAKREIK